MESTANSIEPITKQQTDDEEREFNDAMALFGLSDKKSKKTEERKDGE